MPQTKIKTNLSLERRLDRIDQALILIDYNQKNTGLITDILNQIKDDAQTEDLDTLKTLKQIYQNHCITFDQPIKNAITAIHILKQYYQALTQNLDSDNYQLKI